MNNRWQAKGLDALSPAWAAAAIALLASAAEIGGEPARLALRYQRLPLEQGEIWRLLSAHIVHLGASHLLMNLAALAALAWLLAPLLGPLSWLGVLLSSALAIDAGLYWLSPEVDWYVGLSGVLHGAWAGACVLAWPERRREAYLLSLLLALKLGYEAIIGPTEITAAIAAGPVVAVAHAYGAAGGVVWGLLLLAIRWRRASL